MSTPPVKKPKPLPPYMNFLIGGVSGAMGSSVVHPFDVIKNGIQLSGTQGKKGTFGSIFKDIMSHQGISGFYQGLTASILKQMTYTTMRMGVYNGMMNLFTQEDGTPPGFGTKIALGMWAGVCGAIVGNPAEVCLVRMAGDGRLPAAERRNYTCVANALARIVKEEGILTLWRGVLPFVSWAILANGTQLATYSQSKEIYERAGMRSGIPLQFCSALTCSICSNFTTLPADIIKTRMQHMKIVDGKPQYTGVVDVLLKIVSKEGPLTLWTGFFANLIRIVPNSVLVFIILENLTAAAQRMINL